MRFHPPEAFFAALILLSGLFFADAFFAVMVAVIFGSLALGALLLSGLAELIERSKVPRNYFGYLLAVVLATGLFLVMAFGWGGFEWDGIS